MVFPPHGFGQPRDRPGARSDGRNDRWSETKSFSTTAFEKQVFCVFLWISFHTKRLADKNSAEWPRAPPHGSDTNLPGFSLMHHYVPTFQEAVDGTRRTDQRRTPGPKACRR